VTRRHRITVAPNLAYGLDVWRERRKVLNIEWAPDGRIDVVGFKRGDWGQEFLSVTQAEDRA
jgi:hypothetical protein